jgi:N-carbamoyl-D-amino-acid hydrolase
VGAAQLGPIQRADSRPQVVKRLLDLLHRAKAHGCDLDLTRSYKDTVFNFARHRRPEHYRMIVDRTGAIPPA